jgi:hypothetical protein
MKNSVKYFVVLLLTAGIFTISWYVSVYFNQRRIVEIRDVQQKVATDILSAETDFSLLQELSCDAINESTTSEELASLASRISFTEQSVQGDQIDVLKKQYTLLQVKDYLLKKRISERCKTPLSTVLYFYGTDKKCDDCTKQGYVLDAIRTERPDVRVYSFDYNLDLSTIKALRSVYNIGETLPALVINGKTYSGYQSLEQLRAILPKEVASPKTKK